MCHICVYKYKYACIFLLLPFSFSLLGLYLRLASAAAPDVRPSVRLSVSVSHSLAYRSLSLSLSLSLVCAWVCIRVRVSVCVQGCRGMVFPVALGEPLPGIVYLGGCGYACMCKGLMLGSVGVAGLPRWVCACEERINNRETQKRWLAKLHQGMQVNCRSSRSTTDSLLVRVHASVRRIRIGMELSLERH